MRTKSAVLVILCTVAALTLPTAYPQAQAPNIVWQTTFDSSLCPDWVQTMGLRDEQVCQAGDGIQGWGAWTTAAGGVDTITAAWNNPNGGGGKGFCALVGPGNNNTGGGLKITFPTQYSELWVRWYMRYAAGMSWQGDKPHHTKDLYFNDTLPYPNPIFVAAFNFGEFGIHQVTTPQAHFAGPNGDWQQIMGGKVGDGRWHAYEVHIKMDTNGANGIAESWVDGTLINRTTNANWLGSVGGTGWKFFSVGVNHGIMTNTSDMCISFDDFAISTSGYIGPIGGQSTTPRGPAAPSNLRVTS